MAPSLLVVSRWLAAPPDNGARIRRSQLLAALATRFDVDVVALLDDAPRPDDVAAVPARVHVVPQPEFVASSLRARLALLGRTPRAVTATFSGQAAAHVAAIVRERNPALVIADEIHTASYVIGCGRPVLVEEIQVGHLVGSGSLRDRIGWWKNRDFHRRVLRRAAAATVPSEREAELVRAIVPRARVEVIANGVDTERLLPDPSTPVDTATVVYAGSPQFEANLDAVSWFARDVLPRVRAMRPVRLVVTGAVDGVRLPEFDGVDFVGRVDDVAPVVRGAGCSVVPLRVGGGTRIKVLEALALGSPVVATTKGVEGLGLVAGREVLVADDAARFAAAVLQVTGDAGTRSALVRAGRAAAEHRDWAPIRDRFVELATDLSH